MILRLNVRIIEKKIPALADVKEFIETYNYNICEKANETGCLL